MLKYEFKEIENPCFPLWDHGWCDIIYCHVSGLEVDFIPTVFFASLLDHQIYRRGYDVPSERDRTRDTHGPFTINKLKPSNFVEISFEELTECLRVRYADSENFRKSPDKTQIEAVDDFINQLPKEGMKYFKLAVSHKDPDYHYEFWNIHIFFDEYILLHPQQQAMWIIVIGYD